MLAAMPTLPDWSLRQATEADVPRLAALYADTARSLGAWCYTPSQVQAWASFADDAEAFRDYVMGASTWVAQRTGAEAELLGFCGVDAQGEVRSFYVQAGCTRRGLGTALLRHALAVAQQRGMQRFTAWATPFSRPVFERAGFALVRVVSEPFQGVMFDRYRMERHEGA
jgi:putative acetyltransferase